MTTYRETLQFFVNEHSPEWASAGELHELFEPKLIAKIFGLDVQQVIDDLYEEYQANDPHEIRLRNEHSQLIDRVRKAGLDIQDIVKLRAAGVELFGGEVDGQ